MNRNSKLALVLATAGVVATVASVHAGTVVWDGGPSGTGLSWADPVNWGGDVLPGAGDTAKFGGTGLADWATVSLGGSQTIHTLGIDAYSNIKNLTIGSAADISSGYTLTLTNVVREANNGNTQTIAANVRLAGDSTWKIVSGYNGSLGVSGQIGSASDVVFTKDGSNSLTLSGANTFTGSARVLGGTLTLANSNAYAGQSLASGGALTLNFGATSAPASNIVNSASALALGGVRGGGTLTVSGKSSTATSQTFSGLAVNSGASTLNITNGNASGQTAVNLGAITQTRGGTVTFTQPTNNTTLSATNGYGTSTANANGILGGWAVVGGTEYATNNGTNIVAYTGYTDVATGVAIASDASKNMRISSASTGNVTQSAGTVDINTLRVNDAAARIVTVGNGNTLRLGASGGVLATGTNGLTIGEVDNAGTLTAGGADNTAGEITVYNSTAVAVNSAIADNGTGAVSLTKSGAGTLTLNSANTYSGGTVVNAGTLAFAGTGGANRLSTTGKIEVTGGTLNFGTTGTQSTSGEVIVAGGTMSNGTLTKSGADFDVRAGTISTILAGSVGLVKTTSGSLTLSGANTYTGDTWVKEGSLSASVSGSVKGNLIVGTPAGGPAASYGQSNTPLLQSKKVTVYANGYANMGSSAQAITTVEIYGGEFNGGSQTYLQGGNSITMTGGTLSGTYYLNTANVKSLASSSTATVSGAMQRGISFDVADGAAAVDLAFTGTSQGAFAVTKNGAGVLRATGSNGYTGATAINAGTFWVSGGGNINGTSGITVNNAAIFKYDSSVGLTKAPTLNNTATFIYNSPAKLGANVTVGSGRTLGGSGSFAGVTVNGNLAPGNSPGAMTMDSLVLGSTAVTTMEIGGDEAGTEFDRIDIAGNVTFGGALNVVAINSYDLSAAGSYDLFNFAAEAGTSQFASVTVAGQSLTGADGVWSGGAYTFHESTGMLTVPEPGLVGMTASVVVAGLLRRRQRA